MVRILLLWFFLFGFVFLVFVGAWAIITIQRMKHEQQIGLTMLNALLQREKLKAGVDDIQRKMLEP